MKSSYKPLIVAVFLGIAALGFGFWSSPKPNVTDERGVLGDPSPAPTLVSVAQGAEIGGSVGVVEDIPTVSIANQPSESNLPGSIDNFLVSGSVQDPGVPIGPAFDRSGMVTYTVQKGDNLASIASYFDISAGTILSANPNIKKKSIHAGEALQILPTSGVVYQTESGDTLASIAANFNLPQDKILQFNQSVNFSSLPAGASIIIPGGVDKDLVAVQQSSLPNFNSNFIMPAQGYNWGILENYNAVDIANSCGTPVVAAADGIVVPDDSIQDVPGGWNGGYGNFVLIKHLFGNDIRTRYAHLGTVLVQVGDYVKQGQEIGLMGESGDATGCEVYFEVIGAQNPFVKS